MKISGAIDVKNSTTWDPAPLSGASTGDCSYSNPPAPDDTSVFSFQALFAPTPTEDDRLKYQQVWSRLETPTPGGIGINVIYGVGVDFEGTFTI